MRDLEFPADVLLDLRIAIDWSKLPETVLDGRVGIYGCRALGAPEEVNRLAEQFEHYVELDVDQWLGFTVGPDNREDTYVAPELGVSLQNILPCSCDLNARYTHRENDSNDVAADYEADQVALSLVARF